MRVKLLRNCKVVPSLIRRHDSDMYEEQM